MLAAVRIPSEHHILLPIASWKQIHAISDVATISKLNNSDAFAAVVRSSPHISSRGASTSSRIIATVHGISFRESGASTAFSPVHLCSSGIPIPAPRYRNATMYIGERSASSSLDSGAFSPNSSAASSARKTGAYFPVRQN